MTRPVSSSPLLPRPGVVCLTIALLGSTLAASRPCPATAAEPSTIDNADALSAQDVAFALRYHASATGSAPRDEWWARDKARHVVFSTLWTLSTQYLLVSKAGWSEADALPLSIGSAAAAGLGKELYDRQTPEGRVSVRDLVADAIGIGLAVGLISL